MKISGNIVDVLNSLIYPGTLEIENGKIIDVVKEEKEYDTFILPGFVDSHVHIESSMLVPSEFARLAVVHGTVATVSDPHEIGNVLGIEGVKYMIENGKRVPFKFYFGAPSCVPATSFETAGAAIGVSEVEELLKSPDVKYLSEMMNVPGVLSEDPAVMAKIQAAKNRGKRIDGHAPGLRGEALKRYIAAGPSTDHETTELEEAKEKISLGMKILIREGSAAKSFDAFSPLIEEFPRFCMLCADDKHPDSLLQGHINELVKRALQKGIDRMKVLQCACVNPVKHYGLEVGLLQQGDPADFIVIDNFERLNILKTYINGQLVAEQGKSLIPRVDALVVNNFSIEKKQVQDFTVTKAGEKINVIEVTDGQLITKKLLTEPRVADGLVVSDPERDILKIAVVNRYTNALPAVGFIKNIGLKKGALASSVAHDCHNIIAVGVKDQELCDAVNLVIEHKGGLAVVSDNTKEILPLPVAGIMTNEAGEKVAVQYARLDALAKQLGSSLQSPFMTLSFMTLLVIPSLKMSDKGLFDGEKFEFVELFD